MNDANPPVASPYVRPEFSRRWWICGVLLLATMLNYMDRQALPQIATHLKLTYDIGDARYGLLEAYFSRAFGIGAVLFGFLADRLGPRRIYPLVIVGWSVAGLLTPFLAWSSVTTPLDEWTGQPGSGPFYWLLGCRTMLGFFEAGHWPCALLTARQILSAKDRPLGNGILQSGATIGTVMVIGFVAIVRHMGGHWALIFWSVGFAGLLWVPLWLILVRPGDLDGPPPPSASDASAGNGPRGWAFMRMLLTLVLVVGSISVSWQFLRAWMPKWLVESQGFSADFRDTAVIAYNLFADVGALFSGILVHRLVSAGLGVHSSRVIGFALLTGVAGLAALVPVVGGGYVGVGLLILAGAGILGLHPFYYALVQELPARNMGMISGLLAACAWLTTAEVQKALGAHIEATGSYSAGFVLVGLAPLVGLAALLILWRPSVGRNTIKLTQ